MDLKTFLKSKKKNVELKLEKDQKEFANVIEEQTAQYAGKSEEELMSELLKATQQGKKDGSFTTEKLNNFLKSAGPMLTSEQRERLNEIAKKL